MCRDTKRPGLAPRPGWDQSLRFLSCPAVSARFDPLVGRRNGAGGDHPLTAYLLGRDAALLNEPADIARVFPVEGAELADR